LALSKKWSVDSKSSSGVGLDLKRSGSGGTELSKGLGVGGDNSGVGLESCYLGGVLSSVVTKGGFPTTHVTWERGGIGSSRSGDFVSELGDEADYLFNGGTIASLSEHGESVDEREVGGVLSERLEFISHFF